MTRFTEEFEAHARAMFSPGLNPSSQVPDASEDSEIESTGLSSVPEPMDGSGADEDTETPPDDAVVNVAGLVTPEIVPASELLAVSGADVVSKV